MNYSDIYSAVIEKTERPDRSAETASAIAEITLALHLRMPYVKDIVSAKVVFDYSSYIQELEVASLPRYRKLAFVRKTGVNNRQTDGTWAQPGTQSLATNLPYMYGLPGIDNPVAPVLDVIDAGDIINVNGFNKNDVCYEANGSIYMRSSCMLQFAEVGWFSYPLIDTTSDATFISWIAKVHPWAIIWGATARIFNSIGQNDMANQIMAGGNQNNPPGPYKTWTDIIDAQAITLD